MTLTHNQWAVVAITVTLCLAGTYSMASSVMSTSNTVGDFEPGADDILDDSDAEMDHGEDTDGDGLPNRMERTQYGTDPLDEDTDGDGMLDGYEVENGLNPLDSGDAGLEDIIIDTVTGNLPGVDPHLPGQILVRVANACVNDGYNHVGGASARVPSLGCTDIYTGCAAVLAGIVEPPEPALIIARIAGSSGVRD